MFAFSCCEEILPGRLLPETVCSTKYNNNATLDYSCTPRFFHIQKNLQTPSLALSVQTLSAALAWMQFLSSFFIVRGVFFIPNYISWTELSAWRDLVQAANVLLCFKNRSWQPCSNYRCNSEEIPVRGKKFLLFLSFFFHALTVLKIIAMINALISINYCISSAAYIFTVIQQRLDGKSKWE